MINDYSKKPQELQCLSAQNTKKEDSFAFNNLEHDALIEELKLYLQAKIKFKDLNTPPLLG